MGGSRWSEDHYHESVRESVSTRGTSFVHHADITEGKAEAAAHADLDPAKLKNGVRESRDSEAHPESNAVLIGLDVTGSMGRVVRKIHERLPALMGLLTRKNYLPHPQICFCAIGDAQSDDAPLQVGQFESGAEMEGDLSKVWIEGRGGPFGEESYEMFAYFGARHTVIDCHEKRGAKGYCFIIGDERPYEEVTPKQVVALFGGQPPAAAVSTEAVFAELAERYHVFVVLPTGSSGGTRFQPQWECLVGPQHVLVLDEPSAVAELIAAQIGMCEGATTADSLGRDLADEGASHALVRAVEGAVSTSVKMGSAVAVSSAFDGSGASLERL